MSHAKPSAPIQRFFRRLFRWLRRQIGVEQSKPPGTLEGVSDRATLWRVHNYESGVIGCWWVCHRDADSDLVFSLISVTQLREDVASGKHGYRRASDPIQLRKSTFATDLDAYLDAQGGLDCRLISHIVVIAWRSRIPQNNSNGNRRAYLVRPIIAVPCDLQGLTFAWAGGDRHAIRITQAIARMTLRLGHSKAISWEQKVSTIKWLEHLDAAASKVFGQSHVLQPAKRP